MGEKKRSIERRIMRSLLGYTLFTVVLLWVFQVVFLNSYYHIMQKASIMQAGNQILVHAAEDGFESKLEHICFTHSMCSVVLDSKGNEKYSIDMLGRGCLIHSPAKYSVGKALLPLLSGEQEEMVVHLKNSHFRNAALIYAHSAVDVHGERIIIILNASLDPVESTTGILKSQLKFITLVLAIIALIMSKFIASRLSRPIKEITQKAKGLAKGEYTADYDGGGVAEIDELAQVLNFSAEGLSKVEELRRELVANVSHDLKTPLTMIKAYAEMIRDLTGENKDRREEHLDVIISEADRLTALVSDLIQISQDENTTHQLEAVSFNLSQMIAEITSRFSQTHPEYFISVTVTTEKLAFADKGSIAQVLYNLISNAINYTGEDNKIWIILKEADENRLRIEVKDNGIGISEKELPLIWERYYRSKNMHRRAISGSGLGLSIVRSILSQQNLPFGVESAPEKGSCFWFEVNTAESVSGLSNA